MFRGGSDRRGDDSAVNLLDTHDIQFKHGAIWDKELPLALTIDRKLITWDLPIMQMSDVVLIYWSERVRCSSPAIANVSPKGSQLWGASG